MTETGGKAKFDKVLRQKTRKGYKPVDVLSVTTAPGRPDNTLLRATAAASLAGGSSDKVVTTLVDRLVAANKHNLMAASGNLITVDLHGQARTALGPISASAV